MASKKSWPKTPKQPPIDGGVQLASKPFLGVFSATQPHKGNRIIEIYGYGAGDGNRTMFEAWIRFKPFKL